MRLQMVLTATAVVFTGCGDRAGEVPPPQSSDAPPSAAAATPAMDPRPRVLIVGTSLTAGFGLASQDEAYPALLQRKADSAGFGVRIVNAGSSGETSAGALRRIDWLLSEPASVVIIETGANDGLRGLNVDSTAANLRGLVERVRAKAPVARIAIMQMEAPTNLGQDYTRRFRALFGDVARETGVVLLPFLLDGVAGVAALNQSDGIHPNELGTQRVADNVWRGIVPLLNGGTR